jgi:hypothetical protein
MDQLPKFYNFGKALFILNFITQPYHHIKVKVFHYRFFPFKNTHENELYG